MTGPDVCTGSPWKADAELTHAALYIDRQGINIAGLPNKTVLQLYSDMQNADLCFPGAAELAPSQVTDDETLAELRVSY